jgi:hypothetical protein
MKRNQINIKKAVRNTALFLSVTMLIVISSAAFAANIDFSGDWKLNESKSTLGQFNRAAKSMKIQGNVESIAIQRVSTNRAGEAVTSDEKLTFDDKETESTVFGNSKKKSKAKWSDDGKKLTVKSTIAFERNGQTMEFKTTEVWTLSDDGKTLTIDSTTESAQGTNTTKMVYDKG